MAPPGGIVMTLATVDRYDGDHIDFVGDRAVVVGGSMAGLCAARVLADAFESVVVLERDALPDEPVSRSGAPQTSHPHALLEAGRATLEDLFPGFGEELLSEGGLLIDAPTELKYYVKGDFVADGPERLPMYTASRPLFEQVVRHRAADLDRVTLRDGCRFTGYLTIDDGDDVTGVAYRDGAGDEQTLDADLVVDATGRTSRTPSWLEDHGYPSPPVDGVEVDVTYSTINVERPADDRRLYFVPPDPPRTRGGITMPIEGNEWEVILQGIHGDDAPTDRDGFVDFARSLPAAELGHIVDEHEWRSDEIHHYPFPASRRRRYEELDRFPDGLVVTGDAIASFNPVYGQGMSVGALDALLLHHAIADGGLDDLALRFFDRAEPVLDQVWNLAVGGDFEFPETTGPKPRGTDLFNRYGGRLTRRAHSDGTLTDAFYRVIRLERPATSLLRPAVVWRVLRPAGNVAAPSEGVSHTSEG
jgi:2-polyprenyl-6-methoxyphenol hydroxylase-like FAD-dependent oxidoreductase